MKIERKLMAKSRSISSADLPTAIKGAERAALAARRTSVELVSPLEVLLPQSFGDIHSSYLRMILKRLRQSKGDKMTMANLLLGDLQRYGLFSTKEVRQVQRILRTTGQPQISLEKALAEVKGIYRELLDEASGKPALALATIAVSSLETVLEDGGPALRIKWFDVFTSDFLGGLIGGAVGSLLPGGGTTLGFVGGAIAASATNLVNQTVWS
ncbi:MAG: hypothetical protein JNN08_23790 [Bryobacterales bacterium]|nr:hypothetical protein [Bryobacterales bacterium]